MSATAVVGLCDRCCGERPTSEVQTTLQLLVIADHKNLIKEINGTKSLTPKGAYVYRIGFAHFTTTCSLPSETSDEVINR